MTNVPKWISQMSAVALAVTSVSAFAAAPGKPDFLMHQASINLKISSQEGVDLKIDNDTLKTNELINILMRRAPDAKNLKDEKLGLVTGCDVDVDAAALVVYDKKLEIIKPLSDEIVIFVQSEVVETKDGQLQKVDLLGEAFGDEGWLDITGQIKYGKIGNNVAKDGDVKDHWDKDSNCPKKFNSKAITGVGLIGGELFIGGDVVMSGKLNAGSPKFAADFAFPGEKAIMSIFKDNDLDGDLIDPGFGFEAEIEYQITVTNVGDVDLTGVTVEDISVIGGALACGNAGDFDGFLDVDDSVFCVGDRNVTHEEFLAICEIDPEIGIGPGHLRNIAVADSNQSSAFATSNVIDFDCHPDPEAGPGVMSINKHASQGGASVGDELVYTITVVNLGDTIISNVVVEDLFVGTGLVVCESDGFDGILGPNGGDNDTVICVTDLLVTEEIKAAACLGETGAIRNVAVVQGTVVDAGADVPTSKFATDEVVLLDCVNIDPVI